MRDNIRNLLTYLNMHLLGIAYTLISQVEKIVYK